ncbi:MAG: tetratricopeptide repeat protein, partial [Armatimonadetes bacterium]|nr:tetratricopeptide repeat protein [Armatimonadota bacterium]
MPDTRQYRFGDEAEATEDRRQIEELLERANAADTLSGALPLLAEAAQIASNTADANARALCHHAAAYLYRVHGRLADAVRESEAEVLLRQQLHHPMLMARAIHSLGECHADLGNFEVALHHHLDALRIISHSNDQPRLAMIYNDIGVVYHKLTQYDQALKYYWQSHAIAQQIGDVESAGRALGNIGIIQARLEKFDEALQTHHQALELRSSVNDERGVAIVLGSIGNVHAMQGQALTALEYYGRSLAKRDSEKDQRGVAILQRNIAAMLRHLGRYEEAIAHCTAALQLATLLNSRDLLAQFHEEFSSIYEALGDHQQALHHHKQYAEHYSAMLNVGTQRSVAELQAKYDLERANAEREQFRRRMLEWEHTAFRAQVNPHFL